ncbi:hypothetical protein ACJJTC_015661 [Scirpophaga incertulas]
MINKQKCADLGDDCDFMYKSNFPYHGEALNEGNPQENVTLDNNSNYRIDDTVPEEIVLPGRPPGRLAGGAPHTWRFFPFVFCVAVGLGFPFIHLFSFSLSFNFLSAMSNRPGIGHAIVQGVAAYGFDLAPGLQATISSSLKKMVDEAVYDRVRQVIFARFVRYRHYRDNGIGRVRLRGVLNASISRANRVRARGRRVPYGHDSTSAATAFLGRRLRVFFHIARPLPVTRSRSLPLPFLTPKASSQYNNITPIDTSHNAKANFNSSYRKTVFQKPKSLPKFIKDMIKKFIQI